MNLYLDTLYLTPYPLDCWFDCLALWYLTPEPVQYWNWRFMKTSNTRCIFSWIWRISWECISLEFLYLKRSFICFSKVKLLSIETPRNFSLELSSVKPSQANIALVALHKNWSFLLRISWVKVTKSAFSSIFGHIYWRNP